jgi:hypothetical protein
LQVINYAGSPLELFWINSFTTPTEYVSQTKKPIRNSTEANINSYNGHSFQLRFLHNTRPEANVNFTKGPEDETVMVTFDEENGKLVLEQVSDLNKLFKFIEEESDRCYKTYSSDTEERSNCISDIVIDEVTRLEKTKSVLKHYSDIMTSKLHDYTCNGDEKYLQVSTATNHQNFYYLGARYKVNLFTDLKRAKIATIDNFVSNHECLALKQHLSTYKKNKTMDITSSTRLLNGGDVVTHQLSSRSDDPLW